MGKPRVDWRVSHLGHMAPAINAAKVSTSAISAAMAKPHERESALSLSDRNCCDHTNFINRNRGVARLVCIREG